MSEADETTSSSYQANVLRVSSREKYANGADRLQMGEDALALLGFQGALEDGLWAYAIEQGHSPQSWPALIELLHSDPDQPLSEKQINLIAQYRQLRNQIAHGEEVDLDRSDVAAYQQIVWQILRAYGVSVERRTPSRRLDRSESPTGRLRSESPTGRLRSESPTTNRLRSDYPTASRSARSETPTGRLRSESPTTNRLRSDYPTASHTTRSRYNNDYDDEFEDEELTWQEQVSDFIQQNRQFLIPFAIGLCVIALSFVIYQVVVGDQGPQPLRSADFSREESGSQTGDFSTLPQTAVVDPQLQNNSIDALNPTPDPFETPLTGYSPPILNNLTPVPENEELLNDANQFGNLVAGGNALVLTQQGDLNVRNQPGIGPNSPIIAVFTSGTTVEVLEGPLEVDGFTWWKVRGQAVEGLVEGWCVGDFLVAAAGP
jgi:hypothetical protein